MKNNFYSKLGVIFGLILLLLIPRAYIGGVVYERQGWRQKAYDSIGQSWPGAQALAGPVLALPYVLTYNTREKIIDSKHNQKEIVKEAKLSDTLYLIPEQLRMSSQLKSSERYRGIYQVPVYASQVEVSGKFNTQPILELLARNKDNAIRFEKPQLNVLVRDQRGVVSPSALSWGLTDVPFKPGGNLPKATAGMHASLPDLKLDQETRSLPFAFKLELRGMRAINFALLANDSEISLKANWPHPHFTGQMLPEEREIGKDGFSAVWHASSFSYNVSDALDACRKGNCQVLLDCAVGFDLLKPIDIYQESERSIKYAELFIVLTFIVLILFELLKKLRLHPVQYALVGTALLMFYLLLIALSEHIRFFYAYVIGAFACTALLTCYFGAILRSRTFGLLLGLGLSVLYGVLYVILQAEDYAMLMGSLLLFGVLAGLMLVTRHLDWYLLTGQGGTSSAERSTSQTQEKGHA
ncbi:MAG: cell envelope integrity protein CreD [Methylomicrobium sp.]